MDGVLNTRSSWVGKHEVVEVTYDKDVVEYAALLKTAIEEGCADRAFTANDAQLKTAKAQLGDRAQPLEGTPRPAKASEQLYYLERSEYAKLPLTPLQARRVNGALHAKQDASRFLSPRQIATRDRVREARTKDAKTNIVARLAKLERPDQLAGLADYATSLERTLSAQAK